MRKAAQGPRKNGGKDVRVLPREGGWKVTVDGKTVSVHRLKERAVDRGRQEGKKGQEPAELRIHGRDGKIQEERTYKKKDPYPPKG